MKFNKTKKHFLSVITLVLVTLSTFICYGQEAVILPDTRLDFYTLGGISYHESQISGHFMFGMLKNFGGFIKLKSNFHISFEGDGDEWGTSDQDNVFEDEVEKCRIGITVGCLQKIAKPLTLYAGLGYGLRWENWQTDYGNSFRVTDKSYNGIQADLGVIFKIKRVLVSAGVCPIFNLDYRMGSEGVFDYTEIDLGVGYSF